MGGTTAFPGAIDSFPTIGPSTQEDATGIEHDVVHENVHAAVLALQAKVGIDGSLVITSLEYRVTAAHTLAAAAIPSTAAGAANGVATLDSSGKVPSAQLPAGTAAIWGNITGTLSTQTDLQSALSAKVNTSAVGVASGIAPLDGSGKVATSYLPAAVLGALSYQGGWDASAGTQPSSTPAKGYYFIVTTAGSTSVSGITDWKVGDWAVYDGSAWEKVDNTDAVSMVAGLVGNITISALKTALSLDNVENTALSTWGGSSNIATLGTITVGVWNGTVIGATKGGTGFASFAVGDLLYASSTSALSRLAATTDGYVLTLVSGVPAWAAATGGSGGADETLTWLGL